MHIGTSWLGGRATARDEVVELYRERYPELVRFARVLVRENAVAEDIAQDAFIKLYGAWGRLRDPERAMGYLRVTVLNLARERARRAAVARRHATHAGADMASAEDDVLADAQRQRVIDAVQQLSTRQRECLVLRHYGGLTESEIADALGCSVRSVRTHVKRGMSALAGMLAESEIEVAS